MYHGLGNGHLPPLGFLMRPLLNGGTLGGRAKAFGLVRFERECPPDPATFS